MNGTCIMMELHHNINVKNSEIQNGRHKKSSASVSLHHRFGYWTLNTHHTEPHLRHIFIRFAFQSSLQETQTGMKWPTSWQRPQQTCTTAFSKQLTASSGLSHSGGLLRLLPPRHKSSHETSQPPQTCLPDRSTLLQLWTALMEEDLHCTSAAPKWDLGRILCSPQTPASLAMFDKSEAK